MHSLPESNLAESARATAFDATRQKATLPQPLCYCTFVLVNQTNTYVL